MFDSDIEKKIIKFIKESPIGVTSSEIAKYLDVNRMTMTKYLAIIREKSLIDFKRLGMAKMWYVPVKINKEEFLKIFATNLAKYSNNAKAIEKASSKTADRIVELYKEYYGVQKLNMQQVVDSINDVHEKIGGQAAVEKNHKKLIVRITKCPFGDNVKLCSGLCEVTKHLVGKMISENLGYSKVVHKGTIAEGSEQCHIDVYFKDTKEEGKEFKS